MFVLFEAQFGQHAINRAYALMIIMLNHNCKASLLTMIIFDQNGSKIHSERSFSIWGGGGACPQTS